MSSKLFDTLQKTGAMNTETIERWKGEVIANCPPSNWLYRTNVVDLFGSFFVFNLIACFIVGFIASIGVIIGILDASFPYTNVSLYTLGAVFGWTLIIAIVLVSIVVYSRPPARWHTAQRDIFFSLTDMKQSNRITLPVFAACRLEEIAERHSTTHIQFERLTQGFYIQYTILYVRTWDHGVSWSQWIPLAVWDSRHNEVAM